MFRTFRTPVQCSFADGCCSVLSGVYTLRVSESYFADARNAGDKDEGVSGIPRSTNFMRRTDGPDHGYVASTGVPLPPHRRGTHPSLPQQPSGLAAVPRLHRRRGRHLQVRPVGPPRSVVPPSPSPSLIPSANPADALPCVFPDAAKATFGDGEWYFFSPRERKYPNGYRPNRAAASGYWKATGIDKPVVTSSGNAYIGVKKALVFYKGRPPRGVKTNWIMHEYRLAEAPSKNSYKLRDLSMKLDDWVLCRIYKKNSSSSESPSAVEDVFIPTPSITTTHESLSELLDAADYSDVPGPENRHNIGSGIHSSRLPHNLKRQRVANGNEVLSSPTKRSTGSGIDTDLIDDLEFDLWNPQLLSYSSHLGWQ
ncbi:hypothetical protein BHM03_00060453 [Ensete ventricosum]|nr:hypothetical protein BHM03_00060453 [Ensete ventricosum]